MVSPGSVVVETEPDTVIGDSTRETRMGIRL